MAENSTEDYVCLLNGYELVYPSEAKCAFANITLFLYNNCLAYLCFALLFIIVVISFFGKIQADYRWFILNQAVWDIAITYGYMQSNIVYEFSQTGKIITIVSKKSMKQVISELLPDIFGTNPYTSLLLLSWSRFLALYYSNFYDRITMKKRVFITIIGFNLIVIIFHTSVILNYFLHVTKTRLNLECQKNTTDYESCKEWYKRQLLYILLLQLYHIFRFIVLLKPVLFLCLSIFAAIMILIKIGRQAKFQIKHNRRDFFISFRIASVIVFQTAINSILVFFESTESIDDVLLDVFNVKLEKHKPCKDLDVYAADACIPEEGVRNLTPPTNRPAKPVGKKTGKGGSTLKIQNFGRRF